MRQALTSPFAVGVASRVGAQICAFALVLVASRSLDLAVFGSFAVAAAVSVIFTTLVYTGIYHILLRSPDIDRDRDTFFVLQLGVGSAGAAVMVGAAFLFGDPSETGPAYALLRLAPIPALASLSAWLESQLVRAGRIRTTSSAVLASEVVALVTAVAMFRAGQGIDALILARFTSMAFIVTLYLGLIRRLPRLRLRRDTARTALSEAWPLWGSVSMGMLSNYGADIVLGAFLNPAAAGAYRAGSRLANTAADVVVQPLGTISWARFARLEANSSRALIRTAWTENMALGFALVIPAMLSLALLAPEIVGVLLDPSWAAATGVVTILALARSTYVLTFLLEPTLTCLGRGRQQFYVRLADGALLVALLLTIGRFSAEAAAVAVLIKSLVISVVGLRVMMTAADIRPADLVRAMAPGLGLGALCLVAILATSGLHDRMAAAPGLALSAGAVVLVWSGAVAGLLRRRLLVLPTP
ncbi:oligosaccharide flippase family protein [Psychromarinibacter sp. C21-152]|uniref:Oligosaccharide flippase family protein n=1 Tax=Psychromarinibacter sediminicola TaxID=3033385 RepID=A0AAE3NTC5_9RHOB|nr:oligosaccharide flippase family protein [Psychromarinibacter sediminicola]MDF0601691.1 oligosaccharide flippase family protein [Psychromarinibacter sediminicola]